MQRQSGPEVGSILRVARMKGALRRERLTTNNRMDLMAAIKALEVLKKPSTVSSIRIPSM